MAIGGSSQVVYDLVRKFLEHNDLKISLVVFFDIFEDKYISLLSDNRLSVFFLHKEKGISFRFLHRLRKTIKLISPDVISSHLSCTFYLNLVVNYRKVKIFHTIHSTPEADLPKIYRKSISHNVKKGRIVLICCHSSLVDSAERLYGVKCYSVNNGIDPVCSYFFVDPGKRKTDLLQACRLDDVKRTDLFVEIVAKLVDFGLTNISAVVAGDGHMKEHLVQLAKKLNVEKNVRFAGAVQDMTSVFSQAKLLLITSSREGSPMVILEANSFGVPVISFSVGAIPEMIEDGKNGKLFDFGDVDSTAKYIFDILSNEEKLRMMSYESIEISKTRSAGKMADSYLAIFVAKGKS